MAKRVYKYGLLPPVQGEDAINAQLRLAWEYRREITSTAVRTKRAAVRDLKRKLNLAEVERCEKVMAEANASLDQAILVLKKQRAQTRSRSETEAMRQAVKDARAVRGVAKKALQAARANRSQLSEDEISDQFNAAMCEIRGAYSGRGLYWGTYNLVAKAVAQADKTTMLWDEDYLTPKDPRYPRWNKSGRLGVQLQKGRLLPVLLSGSDNQLRLELLPDVFQEKTASGRGGGKNRPVFGKLWLRVASSGRDPVWGVWPIKLHRPLPKNAVITDATATLRYVGPRAVWTAEISLDDPEPVKEQCGSGVVAVDIGWRKLDDGQLRVAYWRDDQGRHGSFNISPALRSGFTKVDDLKRTRDKLTNDMVDALLAELPTELPPWLLASTVKQGEDLPSSAQAKAWMRKWKPPRWHRLVEHDGWQGACPDVLHLWSLHDRHLWDWERNQDEKVHNRRNNDYRVWAADLARRYDSIIVEAESKSTKAKVMDLRPLTEHDEVESTEVENKTAERNRTIAATSLLRLAIINAAGSRACRIVLEPAADTTAECPYEDCGHVERGVKFLTVMRPPCSSCQRTWDQDDGACVVMLRRHFARVSSGEPVSVLGDGAPKERVYDRRRKAMAAKAARKAAAAAATAEL